MNFLLMTSAFDFKAIFSNFFSQWYYYLILFIFIIIVVLFFVYSKKHKATLNKTQKICYTAILAAIATLLNIFDIKISDVLQISLLATIGFLSGYLLGGTLGFAVCFVGDLLAGFINPHGVYNPIIGIGSGLWGFIPGIIFSYSKLNKYVNLTISFIICSVLISGLINTFGIYLMYGKGKTFIYYFSTYPLKLAVSVINYIICIFIIPIITRLFKNRNFAFDNIEVDKPEADRKKDTECHH